MASETLSAGMAALAVSPAKPGPPADVDGPDCAPKKSTAHIGSLPDDLLAQILACLPQAERAATALVCARWAAVSRGAARMWPSATLELWLCRPGAAERPESFVSWLLPRVAAVTSLAVLGRAGAHVSPHAAPPAAVWSDVVGALAAAGRHLEELSVEWPAELVLSGWVAALGALRCASFSAPSVVVGPGLAALPRLTDLRFKSSHAPLSLGQLPRAPGAAPPPAAPPHLRPRRPPPQLLPPALRSLRMDGCCLTSLPPSVAALRGLTDLVLSNNALAPEDLAPLSAVASLVQLTLMGARMARLPPALSALTALRVLYLDGVAAPAEQPSHVQLCEVLGPLRRLGVLSLGSSRLEEFPACLAALTSLRALYLDNNPALAALPEGPYLRRLRVLGLDWRVLFASHPALRAAPLLRKLCLTSMGGVEHGPHSEADASRVCATLASLPRLRQVLLPMVDGNRLPLFLSPLNVALALAARPQVSVRAVEYGGISNEWIEFLDGLEREEGGGAGAAGAGR